MRLFKSEEEFAEVSLEECFFEESFFGSAFDELAAFAVAVEIEAVEVEESVFSLKAKSNFEDFEGVVLGQAADAIETVAEGELMAGGGLFERAFFFSRFLSSRIGSFSS